MPGKRTMGYRDHPLEAIREMAGGKGKTLKTVGFMRPFKVSDKALLKAAQQKVGRRGVGR